eukprot:4513433-Pyramimonas_sp.AAC.1
MSDSLFEAERGLVEPAQLEVLVVGIAVAGRKAVEVVYTVVDTVVDTVGDTVVDTVADTVVDIHMSP